MYSSPYSYSPYPVDSTPKNPNKSLAQSKSSKRLSRKPSTALLLASPKARPSMEYEIQGSSPMVGSPVANRFSRNSTRADGGNCDDLAKMCFISPRNSKVLANKKMFIPHSPTPGVRDVISIQQIETEEVIQLSPKGDSAVKQSIKGSQKRLSRTSKYFYKPTQKYENSVNDPSELAHTESQLNFMKQENKQLQTENMKMKIRVQDLKEENQFMYSQIESFENNMTRISKQNEQLLRENRIITEKMEEFRQEVQFFKQMYQRQEKNKGDYLVLEHVYNKLRYEHSTMERKNQTLQSENERLRSKVTVLSKLLEQCPIKPQKSRSKSKGRELSPVYNKENCQAARNTIATAIAKKKQPVNCYNIRPQKYYKGSRKEESLFELSPE